MRQSCLFLFSIAWLVCAGHCIAADESPFLKLVNRIGWKDPAESRDRFGSESKELEISGLAVSNGKLYAVSEKGGQPRTESSEPVVLEFTLDQDENPTQPPRILRLKGMDKSPDSKSCNADIEAICVYQNTIYVTDEKNLVIYGFEIPGMDGSLDLPAPSKVEIPKLQDIDKGVAETIQAAASEKSLEGLVVTGSKLQGITNGTPSASGKGPWFYLLDEQRSDGNKYESVLFELVQTDKKTWSLKEVASYQHNGCYRMSDLSITPGGKHITDLRAILCQDGNAPPHFQLCCVVRLLPPAAADFNGYAPLGLLPKRKPFYIESLQKFPKIEGLAFLSDRDFFLATDNDCQSVGVQVKGKCEPSAQNGTVAGRMQLPGASRSVIELPHNDHQRSGKARNNGRARKGEGFSTNGAVTATPDLRPALWVGRGVPHGFHPSHPMTSHPMSVSTSTTETFSTIPDSCYSPVPKLPPVFVHQPQTVPKSERMAELWLRFPEGIDPWVSVNFVDYPPEGNVRVFRSGISRREPRRYYISASYREGDQWIKLFAQPAPGVVSDEESNSSYVDLWPGSRVSVRFGRLRVAENSAGTAYFGHEQLPSANPEKFQTVDDSSADVPDSTHGRQTPGPAAEEVVPMSVFPDVHSGFEAGHSESNVLKPVLIPTPDTPLTQAE